MSINIKVQIPRITSIITATGNCYLVGGLSNADIKELGREITKSMLMTAKGQRAVMRKKGRK